MRLLAALTAVLAATSLGASASGATRAQLALMVLPRSELGAGARGLDVAIGSGYLSNAVAGSRTLDPNDTEPQLDRAGRVTGYSLGYLDVAYASLARGAGLIAVESDVDLYRSPPPSTRGSRRSCATRSGSAASASTTASACSTPAPSP